MSALSFAPAVLHPVPVPARAQAWRPGLAGEDVPHGEIFAPCGQAAGAALALALAQDLLRAQRGPSRADALRDWPDERPWLWVQDAAALRRSGRPYRPGLPRSLRHRLIHVAARTPADALFALEEGLRCHDLAFVIGEIAGNPGALDLTASRRLGLAVQRHGVPFWLIRLDAARDLSSAWLRWDVRSAVSPPSRWNGQAPGPAAWRAELFRARRYPPGEWVLGDDGVSGLACHRVQDNAGARAGAAHG
jgi:protein ImuA